jgi:hypothetical protein
MGVLKTSSLAPLRACSQAAQWPCRSATDATAILLYPGGFSQAANPQPIPCMSLSMHRSSTSVWG